MFRDIGTNGKLAVITGAAVIVFAAATTVILRIFDHFLVGMALLGIGMILFGLTDGFNDQTHRGRVFYKLGILVFIVSFLFLGYFFFRII